MTSKRSSGRKAANTVQPNAYRPIDRSNGNSKTTLSNSRAIELTSSVATTAISTFSGLGIFRKAPKIKRDNVQDNRVAGNDSPFNARAVGDFGSSICYLAIGCRFRSKHDCRSNHPEYIGNE